MYAMHSFSYQQVGQQDGHDDDKDDPKDVGYFWERCQQATAFVAVAKDIVISKFPSGHHQGLDEGETGIPEGRDIGKLGSIILLQGERKEVQYKTMACVYYY